MEEDTRQYFECENCGAEYKIQTDMEVDPSYCPYCGESIDLSLINIDEGFYYEHGTESESEG